MSLLTHLAQVPDFRQPGGNLRHALLDILVISVLAVLSGADDFVEMATFAERKLPVLRRHLAPPWCGWRCCAAPPRVSRNRSLYATTSAAARP